MPEKAIRVLGIYALSILLISTKANPAAADRILEPSPKKLSFGNLKKLTFKGGNGQYTLNGFVLSKVDSETINLATANKAFRVRMTLLSTVLVSQSRAVNASHQAFVQDWAHRIPLVADILKKHDSIGSIKPVVYDLLEPKDRRDLGLQEELVLLWSADLSEQHKVGNTTLMPEMPFPGQIFDVQYRGLSRGAKELMGKIILQILYVKDEGKPSVLGAFVIVSKPNGDYEFYLVPAACLGQILIS